MDMHVADTALVRKDSIEELCGHRARALELYRQVEALLEEAKTAHARACVGHVYITPPDLDCLKRGSKDFMKLARENIDRDMWRGFLKNTPLGSLMDVDERSRFEEALKTPAECTPETVFATMDRLRSESGTIFRRGLVNAFSRLSRAYRSHDGFKLGGRIILECVARVDIFQGKVSWCMFQSYAEEKLKDIDRVFHVLDGKAVPDYQQGLCAAVRTAMSSRPVQWEVETPYFRMKWFKNGNGHLYLLRDDLVETANLLIAEHYGAAVGAGPDVADKKASPRPAPAPCLSDFFPTPPELAARMVEEAEMTDYHDVLEPSGGEGALVKAMRPYIHEPYLTIYEPDQKRYQLLWGDWPLATVRAEDFLSVIAVRKFDRILMNPPFSRGVDVLHVDHALDFLRPGGRLVAIMSAGVLFRSDAATQRLRARIKALGGRVERLPEGTFKPSGTGVSTVLVVVDAAAAA